MKLNNETASNLIVSYETLQEIIRFKHEALIETNEELTKAKEDFVQKYVLTTNSEEILYYMEYHQRILINFLYFKETSILFNFIQWIYRVSHYKGIDLDIFLVQYRYWKNSYGRHLKSSNLLEVENIYNFLIENHKSIKDDALNKPFNLPENELIGDIYELCITSKKEAVKNICQKHTKSLNEFHTFFNDILSNVMKKIGYMWEIGKINVAKEHIGSRIVEDCCLEIINQFQDEEKKNKTILLTNAPNEFHGMGLKIISKVLEKKGFETINLGTSGSPSEDILKTILEFEPHYIVFGVSITVNLHDVALIIKEIIRKSYQKDFKIIVGGSAFDALSNPKESLNADYYSNDITEIFEIIEE